MSPEKTSTLVNLGTAQTLEFVLAHVTPGSRVLEVGCGGGELAKLLLDNSVDCLPIDKSEEAVIAARSIGVPARQADFIEFAATGEFAEKFDAVLFTRSLHHIMPLNVTLKSTSTLLNSRGKVIVDDFGADLIDEKTAVWFYGLQNLMIDGVSLCTARGGAEAASDELDGPVALRQWRQHHFHKHGIAGFVELSEALAAEFRLTQEQRVPYLFRYFEQGKCNDGIKPDLIKKICDWERALCASQGLVCMGVRWVGVKR